MSPVEETTWNEGEIQNCFYDSVITSTRRVCPCSMSSVEEATWNEVKNNRKRSDVFLEFLLGASLVSVSDAGEEATTAVDDCCLDSLLV